MVGVADAVFSVSSRMLDDDAIIPIALVDEDTGHVDSAYWSHNDFGLGQYEAKKELFRFIHYEKVPQRPCPLSGDPTIFIPSLHIEQREGIFKVHVGTNESPISIDKNFMLQAGRLKQHFFFSL